MASLHATFLKGPRVRVQIAFEAIFPTGPAAFAPTTLVLAYPLSESIPDRSRGEEAAVPRTGRGVPAAAHRAALERVQQAGAHLVGWVALACELQRDWNRTGTAKELGEILFAVGAIEPVLRGHGPKAPTVTIPTRRLVTGGRANNPSGSTLLFAFPSPYDHDDRRGGRG